MFDGDGVTDGDGDDNCDGGLDENGIFVSFLCVTSPWQDAALQLIEVLLCYAPTAAAGLDVAVLQVKSELLSVHHHAISRAGYSMLLSRAGCFAVSVQCRTPCCRLVFVGS